MSIPYLAQAADHQQLEWHGGGIMSILLDAQKTGGQLTMLRSTLPAGAASPVHVHADEDEVILLLRGSVLTSESADMLGLCVPAGMEEFFRAAGWDLSRPKPEGWAITPETMAPAAAAAGQTILGPPLAAGDVMPAAYLAR
jgi:hypothetical protein